jgi:DNA-binding response OmpR family regulator
MPKIAVVGATEFVSNALNRAVRNIECEILSVGSDSRSLAKATRERPDLTILDATDITIDVPGLCQWLRRRYNDLPIMTLCPEGVKFSKELRIDVQLTQPFTTRKLSNRIKKILSGRRNQPLMVGQFTLDPEKRRLIHGEHIVRLTPKEYRLLEVLMLTPGTVLSRKQIMKEVWETDYLGDTRTLDVHVRWVREKIEAEPGCPLYLKTVRRVGYVFDPTEPFLSPVSDAI